MPTPVTFEMVDAWIRHPIEYVVREIPVSDLILGFKGDHCCFLHRPYEQRSEEHRADYDRLRASIEREGVKSPLIVCGSTFPLPAEGPLHVIIGMRRAEIAADLGIETVSCAVVLEDVSKWWQFDTRDRIARLKRELGEHAY